MSDGLAIHGGRPVRDELLPYARPAIDEEDIGAVTAVLRSGWLTTGPMVAQFEEAFAGYVGAREAAAVSSGTAALHASLSALGVKPGDEVIVPAITFAATANCAVYQGATPVFADVDPDTLLLDPESVARRITPRTRVIIPVDYAGQPCDYDALRTLARRHALHLVADASHSLGARDKGRAVGTLAELTAFSLHAVKPITCGEGGVVVTDDPELARRVRVFRHHGIGSDHHRREAEGTWLYEVTGLGYNYRLSDFQCALALSQLAKVSAWIKRRQEIARTYDREFGGMPEVAPLGLRAGVHHGYHLYTIRLNQRLLRAERPLIFRALRAEGIGVNVHFIPLHLHAFYRERFGTRAGQCPAAEAAYETLLTLPLFPQMTRDDVDTVVAAVRKVIGAYKL